MGPDIGTDNASLNGSDVLANLPRHRPGRRTSRRADAAERNAGAGAAADAPGTSLTAGATDEASPVVGGAAHGERSASAAGGSSRATRGSSRASGRSTRSSRGSRASAAKKSGKARSSATAGTGSAARGASAKRSTGIPAQGYELAEEDIRVGRAVDPPSRLELAGSLVELAGEGVEGLVKSTISAGGSLIKRTFELIPRP